MSSSQALEANTRPTHVYFIFKFISENRSVMASGLYTGMVLLDIQKAFDSVNHSILCKTLSALGVKSTTWFESYLNCRSQIVSVNGSDFETMALTYGVPQWSIWARFYSFVM